MGVAVDRRTCDPARWYQRRGAGFSLSPGHAIIKGSEAGERQQRGWRRNDWRDGREASVGVIWKPQEESVPRRREEWQWTPYAEEHKVRTRTVHLVLTRGGLW